MPRRLLAPLPTVLCALSLAGALLPGTALASTPAAAVQGHLARELGLAGAQSGAYVYDMSSGQVLFSQRATQRRAPASVEKLYTATTALERWGPTAQLETTVLGVGHLAPGGVWEGSLYLRGGGDPTFGTASFIRSHYGGVGATVSALAGQVARTDGIHRVTGSVEGDETYFDSLRGEPASGYRFDPFLEGNLSASAFNRGETGSERGPHAPAAFAARRLRAALRSAGVVVSGHTPPGGGAARTPPGAVPLAAVRSPTIAQLLGLTLPPSDNFFAETLLKDLGARFGGAGSTAAGARVVRETVGELGLHPQVVRRLGTLTRRLDVPLRSGDSAQRARAHPAGNDPARRHGCGGAHGDALRTDAGHCGAGPLRGQDGNPHWRLQPGRLLHGDRRGRAGVRVLHGRHLDRSGARAAGQHGDHARELLARSPPAARARREPGWSTRAGPG